MFRTVLTFVIAGCLSACTGAAAPKADPDGNYVSNDGLKLVPVAHGLEFPWGLAALPNGDLLVTEREGRLRVVRGGVLDPVEVSGLPDDILVDGQGGLLGLKLAPDFPDSRTLYLSYSKQSDDGKTTAVISATLSEDGTTLNDVDEIFQGAPQTTSYHFGSRIDFLPDGSLLIGLGDGFSYMESAQNPAVLHGKIARIWPNGSAPQDNPYTDTGGHPAVYSIGHRNIQGLIYDETRGLVFAHEHGPKGGDEVNIIVPGKNYGWPKITYGINYDGTMITDDTEAPGLEQPQIRWVPSIAPSGLALVETAAFDAWQGDLLIGAMNGPEGQKLVRLILDEAGEITGQEDLLADLGIPIRDVISTPEAIYIASANLDGAIYRLEPGA